MLRLKDKSVNLGGYGFLEFDDTWEYISGNEVAAVFLIISKENRRVMLETAGDEGDFDGPNVSEKITDAAMDVLYDLIQAGCIEKVGENEN